MILFLPSTKNARLSFFVEALIKAIAFKLTFFEKGYAFMNLCDAS